MNNSDNSNFGNSFERILVSFLAITNGLMLIYLSVKGPLILHHIKYKTADIINNQIAGQDIVNLFLLSIILIAGGVTLFLKKEIAKYLIIFTPIYLIYFVLSYTLGVEWSSASYTGNSQNYTYHFLYILISSLITLLYALNIFPKNYQSSFQRKGLITYTIVFTAFLLVFASMWMKEVNQVITTGTSRGYDTAPAAFWIIRFFDLGFSIPLGLISIYLLWIRPNESYPIQFMFYGFFVTMVVAINSMSFFMYINNDPTFEFSSSLVFIILAFIIFSGFIYVLKNYKIKTS